MSTIVILVDDSTVPFKVLINLQRITGRSLSELRLSITEGVPIFERELFDKNFEENAASIRAIVHCFDDHKIPIRTYELPENESMQSCLNVDSCEISKELLNNILAEADEELGRQLDEE